MIVFDGIIFSLQDHGGVSVYFRELLNRAPTLACASSVLMFGKNAAVLDSDAMCSPRHHSSRPFERYRNVSLTGSGIFHSSYYRYTKSKNYSNITTVYDFTYENYFSGPRKWVHSWQKFTAIRNSDAIICISENTKSDLQKYLPEIPENRIFVIPLAANALFKSTRFSKSPEAYVIFVGIRAHYKNFQLLVRALSHLTDIHLIAVGGGEFSREELVLMEKLIPHRYRHEHQADTERLRDLYNKALCLVYPSAHEGFGIPVLEAMSAHCPVIALKHSAVADITGEAAILLEAADEHLLADDIRRVAGPEIREQFARKGVERSAQFSWDLTFQKTRAVYET